MSISIKRIGEDIEEYLALCRQFDEQPGYSHGSPDCYSEHAKALKERARAEANKATQRTEVKRMAKRRGRPPSKNPNVSLSIRIPSDVDKWLQRYAAKYDMSVSDVVTKVVGDFRRKIIKT